MTTHPLPQQRPTQWLSGYRGLAALCVVLTHMKFKVGLPYFTLIKFGGIEAVFAFFVLSAFLLTYHSLLGLSRRTSSLESCEVLAQVRALADLSHLPTLRRISMPESLRTREAESSPPTRISSGHGCGLVGARGMSLLSSHSRSRDCLCLSAPLPLDENQKPQNDRVAPRRGLVWSIRLPV